MNRHHINDTLLILNLLVILAVLILLVAVNVVATANPHGGAVSPIPLPLQPSAEAD